MTEMPLADPSAGSHDPVVEDAALPGMTNDGATRMFSQSVMISAIRCTLAYIIFPWVLPALGIASGVGPWIGMVITIVAIGFNLASIRRFWAADHPWKWPISAINCSVIILLTVLLVQDIAALR